MKHPLADTYRRERSELLELGQTLTDEQAAVMTTACPQWSIKDVYAHLAGIATNIVEGNTEGAATEAWANGHVSDRQDRSLREVLNEWQTAGDGVSDAMDSAGDLFPFQLFVDQWTHGWDIRAALGPQAAAEPDLSVYTQFLSEFEQGMQQNVPQGLAPLSLKLGEQTIELGEIGDISSIGTLEMTLFEYARVSMGRRSAAQLRALPWPETVADPQPYIDLLVVWSVNDRDVIDPISAR